MCTHVLQLMATVSLEANEESEEETRTNRHRKLVILHDSNGKRLSATVSVRSMLLLKLPTGADL